MTISLTQSAATHVADQMETRGYGIGIRVGVKTTGCSGMAYVLEFVDKLNVGDSVFEDQGVKIIVDPKSLLYVDGTEMDYVKQGVNEGFEFTNPNSKGECGCGESFSIWRNLLKVQTRIQEPVLNTQPKNLASAASEKELLSNIFPCRKLPFGLSCACWEI